MSISFLFVELMKVAAEGTKSDEGDEGDEADKGDGDDEIELEGGTFCERRADGSPTAAKARPVLEWLIKSPGSDNANQRAWTWYLLGLHTMRRGEIGVAQHAFATAARVDRFAAALSSLERRTLNAPTPAAFPSSVLQHVADECEIEVGSFHQLPNRDAAGHLHNAVQRVDALWTTYARRQACIRPSFFARGK